MLTLIVVATIVGVADVSVSVAAAAADAVVPYLLLL